MRFETQARKYERYARVQKEAAAFCADWLEGSGAGLRALELGAGTGLFTRHLCERDFASLVATDASPAMLEEGKRNVRACEWASLDAWRPQEWHNRSEPLDRLYSSSLLQWAEDPVHVLESWRLLLRPGGRVLVGLFVAGSLAEWESVSPDFCALTWRTAGKWRALFREAGFSVLRSDELVCRELYPSALASLVALHRTGAVGTPACSGANPGGREGRWSVGQLKRAQAEYDRRYGTDEGVPMTWRVLRLEATAA